MDDQKRVFSELIKRQIAILGKDITMAKVKNVPGIELDSLGNVTSLNGDPQILLQELINQFVELSGLIVKKTMESIIASTPQAANMMGAHVTPEPVAASAPASDMASANQDIDNLNKMLDNLENKQQ